MLIHLDDEMEFDSISADRTLWPIGPVVAFWRKMPVNGVISAVENPAEVMGQLARILASSGFTRSSRMQKFLKFIVESTLEQQQDALKEASIGVSVFDRSPGYDPKLDPIVRVEARRLRTKLEAYYQEEGHLDPLIIRLPKGAYLPVFETSIQQAEPVSLLSPSIADIAEEIQVNGTHPTLEESVPESITPSASGRRTPNLTLTISSIIVLAAMALIAGGLFRFSRHSKAIALAPLTSFLGQELHPAISPDGEHLAFVWNGNGGNYDIYIKDIKTSEVKRLTSSPAHDLHPAWSPDGRDIAFLRMVPGRTEVMLIPSLGGPERSVGEIQNSVNIWKADASQIAQSLGPTWSSDGRSLVITDAPGGIQTNGLYMWPLGYEQKQRLTAPSVGNDDFDPSVSPDGRSIAFVRQTSNSSGDLFVLSLQNGRIRQLTFDKRGIRGLTWTANGRSILFTSNRSGVYNLWTLSAAGGSPIAVTANSTEATDPSISRNGLLVFTDTTQNTNIWRFNLVKGNEDPPSIPLISSSRRTDSPQYSPDGTKIVFTSDRTGFWELWGGNSDGTDLRQLTSFHGPMLGTPHWSPDGKSIAFDARPQGHSAIFTIAYAGGQPRLLDNNSFEERMPNWSHDGSCLYFNSNRNGKIQLWKRHLSDGQLYPLTQRAAYDSFESPDGKSIYFLSDGHGIWRVSVDGTNEALVPELSSVNSSRYLAIEGDNLYFVASETKPSTIQRFDLRTHRLQRVATIDHQLVDNTPSLSVSPDEHWMLYAQTDGSNSDIMSLHLE